ncbi:hypothetical protein [Streptomyces mayteni]
MVTLYCCEDAEFAIPYYVLAGDQRRVVESLARQAKKTLNPWTLDELYGKYDEAADEQELALAALLLGIAAPDDFSVDVFSRIERALESPEEMTRWVSLLAGVYTGYQQFHPILSSVAECDPVDWVRKRARTFLGALESEGGVN